ncbi:MAG: hypothetical protein DI536_09430 [Archangium gephyra]|uniref:Uncharacterized protein n=1 Tax=Archangium gephyra TaxID=48 RepID=A0A2W5THA8_9BACT|nr:MAG: hypothetical protein DI536_09430 [Archangium gephyra]
MGIDDERGNAIGLYFLDTTLNVRCTVKKSIDGSLRCLPAGTELLMPPVSTGSEGGFYGDGSCTQQLLAVPAACTTATWFVQSTSLGYDVYRRTGAQPPAIFTRRRMPNGTLSCSPASTTPDSSYVPYVNEPPSGFVAFTRTSFGTDTYLRAQINEGADGSAVVGGVWDGPTNQPARLVNGNTPNTAHLIPFVHSTSTSGLVTTGCGSGQVAFVGSTETPMPAYVEVNSFGGGGTANTSYRTVLGMQNTYCSPGSTTPATTGPGQSVYVLGTPLTANQFPLINLRGDSRTDGQRFVHATTANGTPVTPWPLSPHVIVDGVPGGEFYFNGASLHQVPATLQWEPVQLFSDANCTQALVHASQTASVLLDIPAHQTAACDSFGLPSFVRGAYAVTGSGGINRTVYGFNAGVCAALGMEPTRFVTMASPLSTVLPLIRISGP